MKKVVGIIVFMMLSSVSTLIAQARVDARQNVQQARIIEGRIDGDLTRRESRALRMEQRNIRRAERRSKADGIVTPREKMRLERKQGRANRHIRRAKHNNIER